GSTAGRAEDLRGARCGRHAAGAALTSGAAVAPDEAGSADVRWNLDARDRREGRRGGDCARWITASGVRAATAASRQELEISARAQRWSARAVSQGRRDPPEPVRIVAFTRAEVRASD